MVHLNQIQIQFVPHFTKVRKSSLIILSNAKPLITAHIHQQDEGLSQILCENYIERDYLHFGADWSRLMASWILPSIWIFQPKTRSSLPQVLTCSQAELSTWRILGSSSKSNQINTEMVKKHFYYLFILLPWLSLDLKSGVDWRKKSTCTKLRW